MAVAKAKYAISNRLEQLENKSGQLLILEN